LGADLHASVNGRLSSVSADLIVIEKT